MFLSTIEVFFKQIHNMETQDSNWSCSCSKNFPSSIAVVPFLAFEKETTQWRTVWVGRWLQGAADRAAGGDRGRGGRGDWGAGQGAAVSFRPLLLGYLFDLSLETVRTWAEETYRGGARPRRTVRTVIVWPSCIGNRRGDKIFTFTRKILPYIESSVDVSLPAS